MISEVKAVENFVLTPQLMKDLSGKEDTSELMAIIEMRQDDLDSVMLSDNPFIVLFDRNLIWGSPSKNGNVNGVQTRRTVIPKLLYP